MFQAAHEPITGARELGDIRVYNETAHAVTTMVTSVLPLAQGTYAGGGSFRATGATSETYEYVQHEQMGLSWPDGTWRAAVVHFTCDVPAASDKLVTFQLAQTSPPTFALHADVLAAIAVGWPRFVLAVGAESVDLFHQPGEWIETTPLMLVIRFRGRVPNTPMWGELTVQFHHNQPHARWWLWYGNSWIDDPLRTSPEYTLPGNIALGIQGARCFMRHESIKQYVKDVNGSNTVIGLIQQSEAFGRFPDGNSQLVSGVLQFGADPVPTDLSADAETWRGLAIADVQAVGADWRTPQAFGAFGYVPTRPSWIPDEATFRTRAILRAERDYSNAAYSSRGPWSWAQYGCGARPQSAGAQNDFGITRHTAIAMSGHPAGLKAAQRSAYQEACRASFFREADVTPWTQASRPADFWQGRPHRDSPEKFGKAPWDAQGLPFARLSQGDGWGGMDREHYQFLHLLHYTLLTGDRGARALCDARCELWMAEHTYPGSAGNRNGSSAAHYDAARAIGRAALMAANLMCVTTRADFRAWVAARYEAVEATRWDGIVFTEPQHTFVGLMWRGPASNGHLLVPQYYSWEEMTGAHGLMSLYALDPVAYAYNRTMAKTVTRNMVREATLDIRTTWQRMRVNAWTPTVPLPGSTVTQGAASGILVTTHSASGGWDLIVRECSGQFTTGPITAGSSTTTVTIKRTGFSVGADVSRNDFANHTAAQYYEIETGSPNRQELRHYLWHGNSGETSYNNWCFGALLLCKLIADADGDTATQAIVDPIVASIAGGRGAPGDGFIDTGEAGLTEWSGVVEDPF